MTNLILSIVILWFAPMLWLTYSKSKNLVRMERFVIVMVMGLLLIGFVPHHIEHDGMISIVFLGLSAVLFYLVEKSIRTVTVNHSRYSILLFGLFLLFHGIADGIGIGISDLDVPNLHSSGTKEVLAFSIVLHRLPAGLGIWSFLYPKFGWQKPAFLSVLTTVGTIVGYLLATKEFSHFLDGPQIHIIEYLVAGGLLHFGFHAVSSNGRA